MYLACLECAQRAGTPETASPSQGPGYQCATCRTQWRRSAWGHWQSEGSSYDNGAPRQASPYWPYG